MEYIKEFMPEYRFLKAHGMSEEAIKEFYNTAYDAIRSDRNYEAHNLPLFGKNEHGDGEGGSPDCFVYQRGSKGAQSDWSSIKLISVPLSYEDKKDVYVEDIEITEQLCDRELQEAIWRLTERRQYILELIFDGWSQTQIAEKLGISNAAVSKHVHAIKEAIGPYYRQERCLRISW